MKLSQQQKDLLIGSLLGDGNLQSETKGRTWRYRALHKSCHKSYLFHKYGVLETFCTSPPIFGEVLDPRTGNIYKRWYFNTVVNPSFKHYGNMFYTFDTTSGRMVKDVPKNIHKFLTPRSVAYWYMDDGALKWKGKSNAMRICTESFSIDGVNRLRAALKKLYNIDTNLICKTNEGMFVGYRIAINEANALAFRNLIKDYLVDCMRYKVSDGNYGHL